MKNLEGIKNIEISEESLEKKSVTVSEGNVMSFDDCALTEKEKLERLKAELEATYFEDCAKTENSIEAEDSFEDCRKR